jgi:hypothetical protein
MRMSLEEIFLQVTTDEAPVYAARTDAADAPPAEEAPRD